MSRGGATWFELGPWPATTGRIDPAQVRVEAGSQDDENRPGGVLGWRGSASSFAASAAFHLVTIILLALLSYSWGETSDRIFLRCRVEPSEPDALDDSFLAGETNDPQEPNVAPTQDREEPGEAYFGPSGGVGPASLPSAIGSPFGKDGAGRAASGDGNGGTTFFGVRARGNRFAFVVDGSISMAGSGWTACQRELLAAVGRLKPEQSFYVVLFNWQPHPMFSDEQPEPQPVPATPENLARLHRWLEEFHLRSGTKPMAAMQWALQVQPDTLQRIAADNGGTFRQVGRLSDAAADPGPAAKP